MSCASSPSVVVGPSSSARRRWSRHHHHHREERAARSHHAVASTSSSSSRRGGGARDTMNDHHQRRGDSIASRAMSMSSSSDENEELSLRNQFQNVSLNGEDGSDIDGSAISRSRDDNNNNGTPSSSSSTSPTNSISSFMREGGVYNAQIGKEKPLKINQDLLIEEAKRIRNQSLYARTRKERKKLREAAIETFKSCLLYTSDAADE